MLAHRGLRELIVPIRNRWAAVSLEVLGLGGWERRGIRWEGRQVLEEEVGWMEDAERGGSLRADSARDRDPRSWEDQTESNNESHQWKKEGEKGRRKKGEDRRTGGGNRNLGEG